MKIVMGRGRNRREFDVPPVTDKLGREQCAEDLKVVACRRGMLPTHRFFVLNGA